jgi:hypothetical protein
MLLLLPGDSDTHMMNSAFTTVHCCVLLSFLLHVWMPPVGNAHACSAAASTATMQHSAQQSTHHIGDGHQQPRPNELDKPVEAEGHLNSAKHNSLAMHAALAGAAAAVVLLLLPHPRARHELLPPLTS